MNGRNDYVGARKNCARVCSSVGVLVHECVHAWVCTAWVCCV